MVLKILFQHVHIYTQNKMKRIYKLYVLVLSYCLFAQSDSLEDLRQNGLEIT